MPSLVVVASAFQLAVTACFACASESRKDEDGAAGDGGDAGRAASGGTSGRGGGSQGGGNAGGADDGGGEPGVGGTAVGGSDATGGSEASGGSDPSGGTSGGDSGGTSGATTGGAMSGGTSGNGGMTSGGTSGSGGSSGGVSLIGNGDFSAGMEGWGVEVSAGGPVSIDAADGRLCVEAGTNAAQVVVGWPLGPFSPLTLAPGVNYIFSFKAVATRSIQVMGKLGLVSPPYTPYDTQIVYVSGTWQTFTHGFVLNSGSDSIGVAISFTLGALDAICIDDVTVTSP